MLCELLDEAQIVADAAVGVDCWTGAAGVPSRRRVSKAQAEQVLALYR